MIVVKLNEFPSSVTNKHGRWQSFHITSVIRKISHIKNFLQLTFRLKVHVMQVHVAIDANAIHSLVQMNMLAIVMLVRNLFLNVLSNLHVERKGNIE